METPVYDFVRRYAKKNALRLHMPGHKGSAFLGCEALDITEILGADSLYEADGILQKSEENASALFGTRTFYSAEGSSLCIRAMLYLVALYAAEKGEKPRIAAGRNAHKTFLSAAALLDLSVDWLAPNAGASYLACRVDADDLERYLQKNNPHAVYLTTPDYLGNLCDVAALSAVCRRHGVLLLVDGAHGAYLHFLPEPCHPADLGADLCCASAHKTLPVLTGGAYLHISRRCPPVFAERAKEALVLFGSTSPSYLILQSLDLANRYLEEHSARLAAFLPYVERLQEELTTRGYVLTGDEPLKITLCTKPYGYTGTALAAVLSENGAECEFADPDFLVLMLTPELGSSGMERLGEILLSVPRREVIKTRPPVFGAAEAVMSVREATFSPAETVSVEKCVGRILASPSVGCPPAVPIVVSGERIDASAAVAFAYYGVERCTVVKEGFCAGGNEIPPKKTE